MKADINTIIYYINLMFNSNFANKGILKAKNHNASTYFTSGGCWYYAYMLKSIFPEGDIYIGNSSVGHVIFKLNNEYYDADGKYKPKDLNAFFIDDEVIGTPVYFKTNHDETMEMCHFLINDVNVRFKENIKGR